MKKLTLAQAKKITRPGLHADGGTLFLRVAPGGSKQWVQRLHIHGKLRSIGLGGFPLTTLSEAREAAYENRKLARHGGDPLAERRKADMPTFRDAAEKTYTALRPRWRNSKVATNWMQQLERHAFPRLADRPVDTIGREEVLSVLTPIWAAKPETARRIRRCIKTTLQWCIAHGYIQHNVAGDAIDGALPRMRAVTAHLRSLPYQDIGSALSTVEACGASIAVKLALRFLILTAARSGEVRMATWAEIDTDARTWKIPGARMKAGNDHRVPLSDAALTILEQARILDDDSGLIFPSPVKCGSPFSDMTMTKLLRDTGLAGQATVHGFRSTFRDWCAETGKPRELAEAALAHVVGGVEGAYFRSDLYERRRRLMNQWAAYIAGERSGKVIALHA